MAVDDPETRLRRARLRELFNIFGTQKGLLEHIEARRTAGLHDQRPNQGEFSALAKYDSGKSFGDKKAKRITEQVGLPRTWFAMPLGMDLDPNGWPDAIRASISAECALASVENSTYLLRSDNGNPPAGSQKSDKRIVRPFVRLFPNVDLRRYLDLDWPDRIKVQEAMNDQIRLAELRAAERDTASSKR